MSRRKRKAEQEERCPNCGCPELTTTARDARGGGFRVVTSCPACNWVAPPRVARPASTTERMCTRCRFRGAAIPATFVAGDAEGIEWYECDAHEAEPAYPEGETVRVVRTPIAEWFARAGLPVPGAS